MRFAHSYSGPGLNTYKGIASFTVGRMTIASFFYKILIGQRKYDDDWEMECFALPHENKVADQPLSEYYITFSNLMQLLNRPNWGLELEETLKLCNLKRQNDTIYF